MCPRCELERPVAAFDRLLPNVEPVLFDEFGRTLGWFCLTHGAFQ